MISAQKINKLIDRLQVRRIWLLRKEARLKDRLSKQLRVSRRLKGATVACTSLVEIDRKALW